MCYTAGEMAVTRNEIINELRRRGSAGVNELASATGVTPVSVRHHLSSLQAEGLVTATEYRAGVGRPKLVYSLTKTALERFPTKYVRFAELLLGEMKTAMPSDAIDNLFAAMAQDIATDNAARFEGKTLEQKMTLLMELLGEEGFLAEWNKVGSSYQVTEYNCPYFVIGQNHPEVCKIDQTLISKMLARSVEKTTCLLNGDQRCVFIIGDSEIAVVEG